MTWEEQALKLRCGGRRRIRCCKDDYSMLINHDLKGISCYCFRCGFSSFLPHGIQCIDDINRRNREYLDSSKKNGIILLPDDYTLDVPPHIATWYFKYGISAELARRYKIGYSDNLNRIILPVYAIDRTTTDVIDDTNSEMVLDALQMRAVRSQMRPKYLNPYGPKISSALFWAGKKTDSVIMTEDILSAIKVGKYHYSVSILGTTLTEGRLARIIANGIKKVYVWLDPDYAGIKGTKQAMNKFALQGIECIRIKSEKDPKEYTKKDIMRFINENQN